MMFVNSCHSTAKAEFSTHQILSQTLGQITLYKANDEISLLLTFTLKTHAPKCYDSKIKFQKPTKYGEITL